MWLVFALLSPLFWAIVHVLDSHCVQRVFNRPWMGVITSSLASLVIVLIIPFAAPFVAWHVPSLEIALLALLVGALIQLSQAFYFRALDYSEAGIVAAYWNMIPAFLPVASFVILGGVLNDWHYVGIAILIAASVTFCIVDINVKARWRSFSLMVIASCLQVAALMLEKRIFETGSFFVGFLFITAGIIIGGALPLLFREVRKALWNNMADLRPAIPMIIGIEVANLIALFMSQRAIALGIPSLVAAVETMIPAYTFALSIALVLLTKGRFGDPKARYRLPLKLILVAVMSVGIVLLSGGGSE